MHLAHLATKNVSWQELSDPYDPAVDALVDNLADSVDTLIGGLLVIIGGLLASYRTLKSTRRERVATKRTDTLLELLTLAEREGQYEQATYDFYALKHSSSRDRPIWPKEPTDEPTDVDRAKADALVGAYGTREVRAKYDAWRAAIRAIGGQYQQAAFAKESEGEVPRDIFTKFDKTLMPAEKAARADLTAAVSKVVTTTSGRKVK